MGLGRPCWSHSPEIPRRTAQFMSRGIPSAFVTPPEYLFASVCSAALACPSGNPLTRTAKVDLSLFSPHAGCRQGDANPTYQGLCFSNGEAIFDAAHLQVHRPPSLTG